MNRRALAFAATALVALALPRAAAAHTYSVAYSDVALTDAADGLSYQLRINLADLAEILELDDRERDATAAEVTAGADVLFRHATERIHVLGDDVPCAPRFAGVEVVRQTESFAQITWTCAWDAPIDVLVVDYDLFFDVDPKHTGLLKVTIGPDVAKTPLSADASRFEWELGTAPPASLGAFVASGVDHILYGFDHILFLLALLLISAIAVAPGAPPRAHGLRPGLKYTLAIVTSFTLAHSITLIAAALEWVTLPSRVVESLIAASIAYVAVENLVRPDPPRRWLVTFAFGLMHGVGFASMLAPLLPDTEVVLPLLAFNAGVELGQLAIVALAFPALHAACVNLGPARYRRIVVVPGSILVGAAGAFWLVQRAFDLSL